MDSQEVVRFVNEAVYAATGEHLKDVQVLILKDVWQGLSYKVIAQRNGYSAAYVKQNAGARLWRLLSQVFGLKITKSNFRSTVELLAGDKGVAKVLPLSQALEASASSAVNSADVQAYSETLLGELRGMYEKRLQEKSEQLASYQQQVKDLVEIIKLLSHPTEVKQEAVLDTFSERIGDEDKTEKL